jgi:hypothetical protein
MGAEAECDLRFKGKTARGKARLETEVLQFRSSEVKLAIPFKQISKVVASGGTLRVTLPDGTASFDLGAAAAKWADKIQHPPSRLKKMGATSDWRVSAIGVSDVAFLKELEAEVAHLSIGRVLKGSDAIFLEVTKAGELGRLEKLKDSMKPNGAIWIIRPKGRPEISEQTTMAGGRAAGLVDVKVVAFSATHTAEKFVIPVAQRPKR